MAQDTNQHHDHREGYEDPVPDLRVEYQVVRHGLSLTHSKLDALAVLPLSQSPSSKLTTLQKGKSPEQKNLQVLKSKRKRPSRETPDPDVLLSDQMFTEVAASGKGHSFIILENFCTVLTCLLVRVESRTWVLRRFELWYSS